MKKILIIIAIVLVGLYLYFYNEDTIHNIIGGAVILLLVYLLLNNYEQMSQNGGSCLDDCFKSHIHNGGNYEWLNTLGHGAVENIQFEEPINSGKWRDYTDDIWKIHCKVVDHNPNNLIQAHMNAFVNENRFANLKFTFEDGTKMAPTQQFYELEKQYFELNKLCK